VDGNIFLNRVTEVPFYVITGVVGGLLGAAFNMTWRRMQMGRKRFFESKNLSLRAQIIWKLSEVGALSAFTSILLFTIPLLTSWSCKAPMATLQVEEGSGFDFNHRFDCPPAQVNGLGIIFFGSRVAAIKSILAHPEAYDPRTLLTVGFVFFPLMTLTFGVSLPTGIFMSTVLVGGALGGYAGIEFDKLLTQHISPSMFALLGAAALFAGIHRNVISLCVILVEGTGETKILIPVIITVVVARYVGDRFCRSINHIAMEIKGYPYLDHRVRPELAMFQVKEIMSSPVRVLYPIETVETIEKLLLISSHYGFPVVEKESRRFLGLVRRDQLVALLQCGVFMERKRERIHNPRWHRSVVDSPLHNLAFHIKDDRYSSVRTVESDVESRIGLDDATLNTRDTMEKRRRKVVVTKKNGKLVVFPDAAERHLHVNIGAVMNQGAYCVTESCPASKAYEMYTALGLRHLVILGGSGVVGIVTRSNFNLSYMEKRTGYELWPR